MNQLITKIIKSKQNGYSLIEIIAGLAIGGLLMTGITSFALQTKTVIGDSSDLTYAMMQVENAGYCISRDIQMSSNFTLGENAGFPLQMLRKEIDDTEQNEFEVTYSLDGNSIVRTLIKNEESPVQTIIAKNIDTAASLTNLSIIDGMLIFNVTSTSGDNDVSRTYKTKPRLDLLCDF